MSEWLEYMESLENKPVDSPDHNHWLCILCPWLCPYNVITDSIPKDYNYEYTWLDQIPEGWKHSFGEKMCFEIKNILEEAEYESDFRILDMKEKYGRLCIYYNQVPESIYDKLEQIISKYANISEETCAICGNNANKKTDGWIIPVCDNCYNEFEQRKKY